MNYTTTDDRSSARRFETYEEAKAVKESLKTSDRLLARLTPFDGNDPRNGLAVAICRDLSTGRDVYVAPAATEREIETADAFAAASRDPRRGRHAQRIDGTAVVRVVLTLDANGSPLRDFIGQPTSVETRYRVVESEAGSFKAIVLDGDHETRGWCDVAAEPKPKQTNLRKGAFWGVAPFAPLSRPGASF